MLYINEKDFLSYFIRYYKPNGRWLSIKEYCEKFNKNPKALEIGVFCSRCYAVNNKKTKYCPNCGILMEEVNND